MKRLGRLSLAQQVMLIVALGLVLAQSLNFGLQLRERRGFGIENAAMPAIARLVDAIEAGDASEAGETGDLPPRRESRGGPRRARVIATPTSPLASDAYRLPRVEAVLRARIDEASERGVAEVQAAIQQAPRRGNILIVAVRLDDGTWLSIRGRGPEPLGPVIGELALQTLLILAILLIPLLWLVRSATRPLAVLTREANDWQADREHASTAQSIAPATAPSDVRALVTAIEEMKQRIVRMLRERDVMLGAIGHDLRTPLAALRIQVELLEDEALREDMIESIGRLSGDLDGILALARNARTVMRQPCDLSEIAHAVAADFRDRGAHVALERQGPVLAAVDAAAVRRALANLVENAARYGGAVAIGIEAGERMAAFVVEDDGPGIPEDRIQAAMEPFARLEPSRNRETGGHGLGLAIVAAIARAHGGHLRLSNREEGGLRAELELPLD